MKGSKDAYAFLRAVMPCRTCSPVCLNLLLQTFRCGSWKHWPHLLYFGGPTCHTIMRIINETDAHTVHQILSTIITGFHSLRAWVRVCVLLDYQHKTHIFRKNTTSFTKFSSFVLIGPILKKIQPFKSQCQ